MLKKILTQVSRNSLNSKKRVLSADTKPLVGPTGIKKMETLLEEELSLSSEKSLNLTKMSKKKTEWIGSIVNSLNLKSS